MKALVSQAHQQFSFVEVPDPVPLPDQVLVRVAAVGVCGTDLHSYRHADPRKVFPSIWGHEPSGWIVGGPRDGQAVAINPIQWCGGCEACLTGRHQLCRERRVLSLGSTQGAFADYVAVPDRNAISLSDGLDVRSAALAEPIAVGHHGVVLGAAQLVKPIASARCLVLGGGAIGLGACLSLRMQAAGEFHLVEASPERRSLIAGLEGIATVAPSDTTSAPGATYDMAIDAVGSGRSRAAALHALRTGGTLVHLGLADEQPGFDFREATLREVALLGSYGYRPSEFAEIVAAMGKGRLGTLGWAEHAPLCEGAEVVKALASVQATSLRTLLIP
jgi:L-iditol 2-dehydrogenase